MVIDGKWARERLKSILADYRASNGLLVRLCYHDVLAIEHILNEKLPEQKDPLGGGT